VHFSIQAPILGRTVLAIIPVFALLAVGYGARRFKVLERSDAATLTKFAVDLALPALILATVITRQFQANYFLLPVIMWIAQAVGWLAAVGISRAFKMSRHSTGVAILSIYGNTSFLGYPLTTALFPALLPATVVIDQFGMTILLYISAAVLGPIYGESSAEQSEGVARAVGKELMSPLLGALVVGLALHALLAHIPGSMQSIPVSTTISLLQVIGAATIPVVMVALGMRLSAGAAKNWLGPIAALGVVKLILMPLICFALARFAFHLPPGLVSISVLEAAVPPAATSTVFAAKYRMNSDFSVAIFFVLTLASAITLPILISVLR
jgi:predicted permease